MVDAKKKPPYSNRGVTSQAVLGKQSQEASNLASAGIDWLTCTSDKDSVGLAWFEMFQRLAVEPGEWYNPWYTGKADNHLRWGFNHGMGYIFIASGEIADVVFKQTVPVAKKITRIDVQVTVRLLKANCEVARNGYRVNSASPNRKYGLIQNSRNGQTLYVGSRNSAQFGRVYDKGVESGYDEPGKLWRYEVELKKPVSDMVARQLANWSNPKKGQESHYRIVSFVFDWFLHRGVGPVFAREGWNGIVTEVGRRITSDDKKLEWLRTQVKPTIQYLLGKGQADKLADALGCKIEQLHLL